jgi:preprotein translocase subunit SecG
VKKREVIWLLIRLAGLWLLWQSLEDAVTLMSSYLTAIQEANLMSRSTWVLVAMFLRMGIHLALGLYCLGAGNLFFDLLNREKPDNGDSDSTRTSTLGLP